MSWQRFSLLLTIVLALTMLAARLNTASLSPVAQLNAFSTDRTTFFQELLGGRQQRSQSVENTDGNRSGNFPLNSNAEHVPGLLIVGIAPPATGAAPSAAAAPCPAFPNIKMFNGSFRRTARDVFNFQTAQVNFLLGRRGSMPLPPSPTFESRSTEVIYPPQSIPLPSSPSGRANDSLSPTQLTVRTGQPAELMTIKLPDGNSILAAVSAIGLPTRQPITDSVGCLYAIAVAPSSEQLAIQALTNKLVKTLDLDYLFSNAAFPDDPLFPQQWGLRNLRQPGADINAPEAWNIATAAPITVAVLDSGMDVRHPDLRKNILINQKEIPGNGLDDDRNGYRDDYYGWNFIAGNGEPTDDQGHGTHVAGIIGAGGNNGLGVTGIAWQKIKILPVKVADANGKGDLIALLRGLLYAVSRGARLINASLSSDGPANTLYAALREAGKKGVMLVAIAGNNNRDTDRQPAYPGAFNLSNIITVAATDEGDQRAVSDTDPRVGSNFGSVSVDLGAPGHNILSTVPGGYGLKSGTSQAAPMVTGALALAMGMAGDALNYRDLKTILLASVGHTASMKKTASGGRLNLEKFLKAVLKLMQQKRLPNKFLGA